MMDVDTAIAICLVIGIVNLPFYYMCLNTWKLTARLENKCPILAKVTQVRILTKPMECDEK